LTGGIGGGADVESLGSAPGWSAAGLLIGWFVHGSRSTGFFSSGLGMGGGSGFSEGGCTVDGASGIFCAGCVCGACPLGVWLGEDCPWMPGTLAHTHAKTSAAASQLAALYHFCFLLSAGVSMFTNTIRSFHESVPALSQRRDRPTCHTKKTSYFPSDAWTGPFGASKSKD
jgi:hypothetical protein